MYQYSRSSRYGLQNSDDDNLASRYGCVVGVVIAVVAAIILCVMIFGSYYDRQDTTVTVTGKERVCDSSGDSGTTCRYLIFTDETTFAVEDSIVIGRFDSSDFYGQIRVCHRYDITYYGWRQGFFSLYPNIEEMEDLGRVEGCES